MTIRFNMKEEHAGVMLAALQKYAGSDKRSQLIAKRLAVDLELGMFDSNMDAGSADVAAEQGDWLRASETEGLNRRNERGLPRPEPEPEQGDKHPRSTMGNYTRKFTDGQVAEIVSMLKDGATNREVAAAFNCDQKLISELRLGKNKAYEHLHHLFKDVPDGFDNMARRQKAAAEQGDRKQWEAAAEANTKYHLTEEQVLDVYRRLVAGEPYASIGERHGVTKDAVYKLRANRSRRYEHLYPQYERMVAEKEQGAEPDKQGDKPKPKPDKQGDKPKPKPEMVDTADGRKIPLVPKLLDDEKVRQIATFLKAGWKHEKIANVMGCSTSFISNLRNRKPAAARYYSHLFHLFEDVPQVGHGGFRNRKTGAVRGRTLLTDEQVHQIAEMMKAGMTNVDIAKHFKCNDSVISNLRNRKPAAVKSYGHLFHLFEDVPDGRENMREHNRANSIMHPFPRALTDEQVAEIAEKMHAGAKNKELADEFGVSPCLISKLRSRENKAYEHLHHLFENAPKRGKHAAPRPPLLSDDEVHEVAEMMRQGMNNTEIAKRMRCGVMLVGGLRNRDLKQARLYQHLFHLFEDMPKRRTTKMPALRSFTEQQVLEIYRALADDIPQGEIARRFNTSTTMVSELRHNKRPAYAHLYPQFVEMLNAKFKAERQTDEDAEPVVSKPVAKEQDNYLTDQQVLEIYAELVLQGTSIAEVADAYETGKSLITKLTRNEVPAFAHLYPEFEKMVSGKVLETGMFKLD